MVVNRHLQLLCWDCDIMFECSFDDSEERNWGCQYGQDREVSSVSVLVWRFDQGDRLGIGCVSGNGSEGFEFGDDRVSV